MVIFQLRRVRMASWRPKLVEIFHKSRGTGLRMLTVFGDASRICIDLPRHNAQRSVGPRCRFWCARHLWVSRSWTNMCGPQNQSGPPRSLFCPTKSGFKRLSGSPIVLRHWMTWVLKLKQSTKEEISAPRRACVGFTARSTWFSPDFSGIKPGHSYMRSRVHAFWYCTRYDDHEIYGCGFSLSSGNHITHSIESSPSILNTSIWSLVIGISKASRAWILVRLCVAYIIVIHGPHHREERTKDLYAWMLYIFTLHMWFTISVEHHLTCVVARK